VTFLIGLLQDENPEIKESALESLGKIGDQVAMLPIARLLDDESPGVRSAAAKAIGRMGGKAAAEAVPALLRALGDPEEEVRHAAAQAMGEVDPPPQLLGAVRELLTAPRVELRRAATLALIEIDSSGWLALVTKAAQDPDEIVRQRAVALLGESGVPSAIPSLRQRLLEDKSAAVRAEAAYRLRVASDEESHAVLKRAAEMDENPSVRRWAGQGQRS
jgi:HEAT repeat protein